jgi:hypothetical protein
LDTRARVALRMQAAELITKAMEASDPAKRDRLLAEARALIARADSGARRNGDLR